MVDELVLVVSKGTPCPIELPFDKGGKDEKRITIYRYCMCGVVYGECICHDCDGKVAVEHGRV